MLSIIIPSRNEPYLNKTIECILANFTGHYELLVHIDGKPLESLVQNERIKYIIDEEPVGMRTGINKCIGISDGQTLMKCDAHCAFPESFDEIMQQDLRRDYVLTARRYSLDRNTWERKLDRKVRDFCYLYFPLDTERGRSMPIMDGNKKFADNTVNDTMIFQGSCWVANKDYFLKTVGYLDAKNYSEFGSEQIEIGLNYWLKGGQVKRTTRTWYAHMHKGKRYYQENGFRTKTYKKWPDAVKGRTWATNHWIMNEEEGITHTFEWLIDKFWPIPSWPDNWKEKLYS